MFCVFFKTMIIFSCPLFKGLLYKVSLGEKSPGKPLGFQKRVSDVKEAEQCL